jgi:hypothetical protein
VANIPQTAATEALAGLVERVTFHNLENGFCMLRVKTGGQRDLITVVDHAAMISAGEFVQISGAWVNDRTHGQQFRASFLKASPPKTERVECADVHIPGRRRGDEYREARKRNTDGGPVVEATRS